MRVFIILMLFSTSAFGLTDEFPLEALMTGKKELFPGGPIIKRHSEFRYTVLFGKNRSNGYMKVFYNENKTLERTETYNPYDFKIAWTTFNEKGEMIKAFDLSELGRADRWEKIIASDDLSKVYMVTEVLDPKTKEIKEISRELVDGTQFCTTIMGLDIADRTAGHIRDITTQFRGTANCPSFSQEGITTSNNQNITFASQGSICVDTNCNYDPQRVERFVQETVIQGAQCMAALSMNRFSSRERTRAESSQTRFTAAARRRGNQSYIKKSFGLRNATRLMMLTNQSNTFANYFNSQEQGIMAVDDNGVVNANTTQARRIVRRTQRPIKFFCGNQNRMVLQEDIKNHVTSATAEQPIALPYNTGGLAFASASLPGTSGWPAVKMRRMTGLAPGSTGSMSQGSKAILFHEMLHLIGYPHAAQQNIVGGEKLPIHTACQACCFPNGFNDTQNESFCRAQKNNPQNAACKICAGDYGTNPTTLRGQAETDYRAGRAQYLRYIRTCFQNGNPI